MSEAIKVFYRGSKVDFCVFIDSEDAYKRWLDGDKSIPLSDIMSTFNIYVNTTGEGAEGELEKASRLQLAEDFGEFKSVEEDVIPKILKEGTIQKRKLGAGERKKKHGIHTRKDKPKYNTVG